MREKNKHTERAVMMVLSTATNISHRRTFWYSAGSFVSACAKRFTPKSRVVAQLPGVRLVTWTILGVTWTILGVTWTIRGVIHW
jgi:hypothetical protein